MQPHVEATDQGFATILCLAEVAPPTAGQRGACGGLQQPRQVAALLVPEGETTVT